jgi:hypothetical protein
MSIYEKPVRKLMKDYVTDHGIEKGQVITKEQIILWFKTKYPKIKTGTVSAHILMMSANAPSRVHHNVSRTGEDDLFYQVDGKHFRLYQPGSDPAPIYTTAITHEEIPDIIQSEEPEEVIEASSTGFAYESDLRDFLSRNLSIIEPGLNLYQEEGITGVEFPVGGRFIDILAVDRQKRFVVIELKVSRGYDRVVGQLLRYMAWIEKYHADENQKVRGIIIAREISKDLFLATSKIQDVQLFEYDLSVSLRRIGKEPS